jgi:uncharacterized membrane protein YhiD involved in acid resistance
MHADIGRKSDGKYKLGLLLIDHVMLDWLDIIFRLGAATLTGSLIGIYLELQQKPTGMRTLGLVALASAVAVLAVAKDPDADASRASLPVSGFWVRV